MIFAKSSERNIGEIIKPRSTEGWSRHYNKIVNAIRDILGHWDLPKFVGDMSEAFYLPET